MAVQSSDVLGWLNILNPLAGTTNSVLNAVYTAANYKRQQEEQEYRRKLQQQIFEREDSAVQRQVADYTKAGFNPILAVGGSGSPSGAVVSTDAAQRGMLSGIGEGFGNVARDFQDYRARKLANDQQEEFLNYNGAFWSAQNLKAAYLSSVVNTESKQEMLNILRETFPEQIKKITAEADYADQKDKAFWFDRASNLMLGVLKLAGGAAAAGGI